MSPSSPKKLLLGVFYHSNIKEIEKPAGAGAGSGAAITGMGARWDGGQQPPWAQRTFEEGIHDNWATPGHPQGV